MFLLPLLKSAAASRGAAPAILAPGGPTRSYADLLAQIEALGRGLSARGLDGDARIAVVSPDSADAAVLMLGLMSHAVILPMNPRAVPEDLARSMKLLGARAVVVSGRQSDAALRAAAGLSLPVFRASFDGGAVLLPLTPAATGAASPAPVPRKSGDTAVVLTTSGTTGRPKAVALTHGNILATIRAKCEVLGLSERDRCLSVMPLYHLHGLGAVLCSLLTGGSVIVASGGFAADLFFDHLQELAPTWYTAVPSIHRAILQRAGARPDAVAASARRGGLRLVRSGGAPMPRDLPPRLEGLFHAVYIEASGATEACGDICSNRLDRRRPGSVGLPMPGNEVRVLDAEGRPLGPEADGELVVRGPGVFSGYEGDPEAAAEAFRDGFFRTGDLARYDKDGFFYITGRIKEQINSGGMKVSPGEVDAVLAGHPAVALAAAFALPDERLGEQVAAAVVLKPGEAVSELELQRYAAERLTDYKVPRRVVFVEELPRTANGKIRRVDLAERLGLTETPRAEPPEKSPSSALEQAVAAIFSNALGFRVADPNAPFYSLGGSSLQALQACLAIERRFSRPFPLAALSAHPTVLRVAKLLDQGDFQPAPGAQVVLREGEPGGPWVFAIPGIGGDIYRFHGLAQRLPAEWRVIGLPLPGADGLEPPIDSIGALADRFTAAMDALAGDEPRVLLGYSFGGRVAFEIARRALARGAPPPRLVLFDASAPGWPTPLPYWRMNPWDAVSRACEAVRRRLRGDAPPDHEDWPDALVLPDLPEEQRRTRDLLLDACQRARSGWRTAPVPVELDLIRVYESMWKHKYWDTSDPALGWGRLATAGVRVHELPGTHDTLFDPEHAPELARRTAAIVARASDRSAV